MDSRHLKESIERAEFSLNLELWFGEQTASSNLTLASSRILQLNFHPCRGLHYHLSVLFDYFHLASISLGIHASLIALHQPYIKWVKYTIFPKDYLIALAKKHFRNRNYRKTDLMFFSNAFFNQEIFVGRIGIHITEVKMLNLCLWLMTNYVLIKRFTLVKSHNIPMSVCLCICIFYVLWRESGLLFFSLYILSTETIFI